MIQRSYPSRMVTRDAVARVSSPNTPCTVTVYLRIAILHRRSERACRSSLYGPSFSDTSKLSLRLSPGLGELESMAHPYVRLGGAWQRRLRGAGRGGGIIQIQLRRRAGLRRGRLLYMVCHRV